MKYGYLYNQKNLDIQFFIIYYYIIIHRKKLFGNQCI